MSDKQLSRETRRELDRLVERVARNAGYANGEITYKEHLQAKFERQMEQAQQKIRKYRHKFSLKPSNQDFAEEIKGYLSDGVAELMAEGVSEADALRITMEKFDEAEQGGRTFDDFMRAFDSFGLEEHIMRQQYWYTEHGEAVGLFYAAFMMLGITVGALAGWLSGQNLISTGVGVLVGIGIGVALGLLSHAIFVAKRK